MKIITRIDELRAALALIRKTGKRIALVPTMGNLHAGHLALIELAKSHADFVVASIFVNPLQFGANEDLERYPRTLAADQQKLQAAGCDLLFAPTVDEMYPQGMQGQTRVCVSGVTQRLCGAARPGHFEGVATVVTKLLNLVQPDVAAFGRKDYQQLRVIETLVGDLNLPIQIISLPTVRDSDGLALSSRNGGLTEEQRQTAPLLYQCLQQMAQAITNGERDYQKLCESHKAHLAQHGLRVDYLEICAAGSLQAATADDQQLLIAVAAFLGNVRLIDNIEVRLNIRPLAGEGLGERANTVRHSCH